MAKNEATAAPAPAAPAPAAPAQKVSTVRLSYPSADSTKGYVTDVILEVGLPVAYRDSDPVVYDGDPAAFTREFAHLCAPARVKIDEQLTGKVQDAIVAGDKVSVPVKRRHLRFMDG